LLLWLFDHIHAVAAALFDLFSALMALLRGMLLVWPLHLLIRLLNLAIIKLL
jgi:hypothetical protein